MRTYIQHNFNVLLVGHTGTGKTSTVKKFESDSLGDEWEKG